MIQVDDRFQLVNLDELKKELRNMADRSMLGSFVKALLDSAVCEIEMHRKFNKDYNDYLRFVKGKEQGQ